MTTHVAATRQPFAPLSSSRLQNLTSLRNCQNAITSNITSPPKRKAEKYDFDNTNDAENIDPTIFLSPKRSKALDGSSKDTSSYTKPTNFFLTRAPIPSPSFTAPPRRPILEARAPIKRLNTTIKSSPLSAPAGRSPTRKRVGILNRRKTASPFTRVDPPKFATPSSGLGFSIAEALSGTIPSYSARQHEAIPKPALPELHQPESKGSWFFEIHEDTAEEEATNLMEHSTCTLDISSDEESAARMRDERGKENVPPPDDVSQTRTQLTSAVETGESSMVDIKARIRASRMKHENAIEIDRSPLGDLAAEDFYAEGCDGASVFLVASEGAAEQEVPQEQEEPVIEQEQEQQEILVEEQQQEFEQQEILVETPPVPEFDFISEDKGKGKEIDMSTIDLLMFKDPDALAPQAALLEPLEKAEDNFELWESGSANGGD